LNLKNLKFIFFFTLLFAVLAFCQKALAAPKLVATPSIQKPSEEIVLEIKDWPQNYDNSQNAGFWVWDWEEYNRQIKAGVEFPSPITKIYPPKTSTITLSEVRKHTLRASYKLKDITSPVSWAEDAIVEITNQPPTSSPEGPTIPPPATFKLKTSTAKTYPSSYFTLSFSNIPGSTQKINIYLGTYFIPLETDYIKVSSGIQGATMEIKSKLDTVGEYNIFAKAYDEAGNEIGTTNIVNVSIISPPPAEGATETAGLASFDLKITFQGQGIIASTTAVTLEAVSPPAGTKYLSFLQNKNFFGSANLPNTKITYIFSDAGDIEITSLAFNSNDVIIGTAKKTIKVSAKPASPTLPLEKEEGAPCQERDYYPRLTLFQTQIPQNETLPVAVDQLALGDEKVEILIRPKNAGSDQETTLGFLQRPDSRALRFDANLKINQAPGAYQIRGLGYIKNQNDPCWSLAPIEIAVVAGGFAPATTPVTTGTAGVSGQPPGSSPNPPGTLPSSQLISQPEQPPTTEEPAGQPPEEAPYIEPTAGMDFWEYIGATYSWVSRIIIILAILMTIWGGYKYMTSGGNPEANAEAKEIIIGALTGIAIVALIYLFFNVINPEALKPPIKPIPSP